jgi:hypothetical protein
MFILAVARNWRWLIVSVEVSVHKLQFGLHRQIFDTFRPDSFQTWYYTVHFPSSRLVLTTVFSFSLQSLSFNYSFSFSLQSLSFNYTVFHFPSRHLVLTTGFSFSLQLFSFNYSFHFPSSRLVLTRVFHFPSSRLILTTGFLISLQSLGFN